MDVNIYSDSDAFIYCLSREDRQPHSAINSTSICSHQIQINVFRNTKYLTLFAPVWLVGSCKKILCIPSSLAGGKGKKQKVKVV